MSRWSSLVIAVGLSLVTSVRSWAMDASPRFIAPAVWRTAVDTVMIYYCVHLIDHQARATDQSSLRIVARESIRDGVPEYHYGNSLNNEVCGHVRFGNRSPAPPDVDAVAFRNNLVPELMTVVYKRHVAPLSNAAANMLATANSESNIDENAIVSRMRDVVLGAVVHYSEEVAESLEKAEVLCGVADVPDFFSHIAFFETKCLGRARADALPHVIVYNKDAVAPYGMLAHLEKIKAALYGLARD